MDNTFIKMADCPEIQRLKEWEADWHKGHTYRSMEEGDYYYQSGFGVNIHSGQPEDQDDENVWLPRQDQLQAMVDTGDYPDQSGLIFLTSSLYKFHSEDWDYTHQFISMEQLWLAFVLKERWNKTWDGNKWVNE